MTDNFNLPSRKSANLEVEYKIFPDKFDTNFTFNQQTIQKSVTSFKNLLRHEESKLPNKFSDLHLHALFPSTTILNFYTANHTNF